MADLAFFARQNCLTDLPMTSVKKSHFIEKGYRITLFTITGFLSLINIGGHITSRPKQWK